MFFSVILRVATDHSIDNTTYLLRDWLIDVQKLYHNVEWRPKEEPRFAVFLLWFLTWIYVLGKCEELTGLDLNVFKE